MSNSTRLDVRPFSSSSPGFSVLELVVAMGVAGLFYGALYSFYHLHAQTMKVQEVKLDLQEGSRLAIDRSEERRVGKECRL